MNKYLRKLPTKRLKLYGMRGEGKFTLVDGDYDGEYFAQFKWYLDVYGYVYRNQFIRKIKEGSEWKNITEKILLHRLITGRRKGYWSDHINRNKLDNRSRNLRLVSPKESAANRGGKFDKGMGLTI